MKQIWMYQIQLDLLQKKYIDIIKYTIWNNKLQSIQWTDDVDAISAKDGDFTLDTIKKLIKEG